jgi:aminocarboxymuconate-semialdehyde decarboxylase
MIIDVHAHTPWAANETVREAMSLRSGVHPDGRAVSTYRGVSSLAYPDFMDFGRQEQVSRAAGVDLRVLSPAMALNIMMDVSGAPPSAVAPRINDAAAELRRAHPETIAVLATVTPYDAGSRGELDRCLDDLGAVGVVIDSSWQGQFYDEPACEWFWEYCERRDVPIFIHPPMLPYGYDLMTRYKLEETVGRPADTAMTAARLICSGVFDRYPGLRILLAHMGGALLPTIGRLDMGYRLGYEGLPEGQAAVCERFPSDYLRTNLWVDTMGFNRAHTAAVIEAFGSDRVLLGTDYGPVPITPREHIDIVRSLDLDSETEVAILGANAVRFFGLR